MPNWQQLNQVGTAHNNGEMARVWPARIGDSLAASWRHFTPESALFRHAWDVAGVVLRLRHHSDNRNASRVWIFMTKLFVPAKL